jgi:putative acetyltransferase
LTITIRPTRVQDRPSVLRVVRQAFSDEDRNGQTELDIVVETWARGAASPDLDLVAVEDGRVLGHVMASRGRLGERTVLGIAPLSVTPSRQGEGIGSTLVRQLIARVDAAGWPLIVLLGDPRYYRRFGFERGGPLGIIYPRVGRDAEAFQALRLSGYDDSWRGDFAFCWELPVANQSTLTDR